jgi:outer membrane biosynthesis protein TonB
LRGVAAVAACLLALASTSALVTAAVVAQTGSAPSIVLTHDGQQSQDGHGDSGSAVSSTPTKVKSGTWTQTPRPTTTAKPTPKPAPTPRPTPKPVPHPKPTAHPSTIVHPVHPQTPAATPKVVVDTSDPAPFSAQAVAATEAARVLPIETLGPLSGVSFGSGLFIWPLLLAVDVLALAVIARMALRRRLVAPED